MKKFTTILAQALCIATSLFLLSSAAASSLPDSESTPFNNEKYEDNADWKLILQAREIKDYLQFKGSPLCPVACVTVESQLRNENDSAWKEKRPYETLWYQNGSPFGLRRYEKLNLKEDSIGIIKIESSPDAQRNTKALINAALRLLPDIFRRKATPIVLMLPHELCSSIEPDLSALRFYKARAITGNASALLLHVVSSRPGYDRYFSYSIRSGEILE